MTGSLQRGVALAAALVLLVALGWTILRPVGQMEVTAYFTRAVGLYAGSDVRILGIKVGTIKDVVPEGGHVRVDMDIDDTYKIPAQAKAVILAPSLVSDRYVQFAPVYDGGPTMKDGATVPLSRTAVPVELDQVYGALDQLSAALGPNGANKNGALSDLVDVGAANLKGNGEQLHQTLSGLSQAVKTLADNRNNLFDSLDNLQTFTSALAQIDAQVNQFNQNLAAVAAQLADERQALASAINLLTKALGDVATFVQQNTALLTTNVDKLADVTLTLAQERNSLAQVLDVAPAALENLSHAYDPDYGTLDTRDNSLASANIEVLVCEVLQQTGRLQLSGVDLTNLTDLLKLPQTDQVCARILSGDPGTTGSPQDLNHNGIPDLQELLTKLFGSGGGSAPASSSLPGLPPVGGSQ